MPDESNGGSEVQPISVEPVTADDGGVVEEKEGPEVLGSHACDICMGDNLLRDVGIKSCARCLNPYCLHFASKVDPLHYCVSCMSAIELTRSVVTKTYEHYDEITDTLRTYSRKARDIKMSGDDWMFAQRRIRSMTDAEGMLATEFHRNYLMLLIDDQERRRNEKAHRNAGKTFVLPSASSTTTTTTVQKKISTVKLDKKKEQLAAQLANLTQDQIAILISKLGGK